MALQRNVRPNRVAAQASRGHFVVMGAGQIRQKTSAAARPVLIPRVIPGREWNERTRNLEIPGLVLRTIPE
jgi:hypothetical protein